MSSDTEKIIGAFGSRPISGVVEIDCGTYGIHAFQAFEDTVIASLKDSSGTDLLTRTKWNAATIPAGYTIYFGFPVCKIRLTSGSGQGFNLETILYD